MKTIKGNHSEHIPQLHERFIPIITINIRYNIYLEYQLSISLSKL